MSNFQNVVGKVLSDATFSEALLSNPEATLRDNGVEPTPEVLAALESLDAEAVQRLAKAFGDEKVAA